MGFNTEQWAKFDALYKEALAAKDSLKIVQLVDEMLELLIAAGGPKSRKSVLRVSCLTKQIALDR